MSDDPGQLRAFAKRVLIVLGLTAGAVAVCALFAHGLPLFLTFFAGVLLAVFLRGLGDLVSEWTDVPPIWATAFVLSSLVLLGALFGLTLWPEIVEQLASIRERLPQAWEEAKDTIRATGWGAALIDKIPSMSEAVAPGTVSDLTDMLSTGLGALTTMGLVLLVGLYLAFSPGPYLRAVVALAPPSRRDAARAVLARCGQNLKWWLVGRISSMTAIGILSTIGLWAIGVPLALPLGFLTGLLTFIPVVGPVLSVVPPLLIGLTQSLELGLWVILLYVGVQVLEGNIVTPIIESRTVEVPAGAIVAAQAVFGTVAGLMGIAVAVPTTLMMIVLVRALYVEPMQERRKRELMGEGDVRRAA